MKLSLPIVLLVSSAAAWQCDSTVDSVRFDLTALNKDFTVTLKSNTPPSIKHSVYRLNPCSPIAKDKDLSSEDQCKPGTQVCRTTKIEKNDKITIIEAVAFAGDTTGAAKAEAARIKATEKSDNEGLRVQLYGGLDGEGHDQSTVIDFICDRSEDVGEPTFTIDQDGIVKFKWHTKHACEDAASGGKRPNKDVDRDQPTRSSSWGFFTWFFLIVFMAVAAFLIFTLFLNYNRYGQVGLDLVPAMDSFKVGVDA